MRKLLSVLLSLCVIISSVSMLSAVAVENYVINEDLSTITNLEADLQNPEKNISYLYSAGAKDNKGAITYSYYDENGVEQIIYPGSASNLTNGIINETHTDVHSWNKPSYVDVETGEATGLALHITFNFPNVAEIEAVLVASMKDNQYHFYTQEYEVYVSNNLSSLYTESCKQLTYHISNNSGGQYIKFNQKLSAKYLGIKITKGVDVEKVPTANRKYSNARLREVAVFGKCNIAEEELIVSGKRTEESRQKLATKEHLNYGYDAASKDTDGAMSIRGFDKGVAANRGSAHSYITLNDLCDGNTTTHADINAYTPNSARQIGFLENGVLKQNTSVDITMNLLFASKIDSVFIAQRNEVVLRSNKYEIYAGNDYATLYSEANKQVCFVNETKAQYQTFVFETPITAKYVGLRILEGVTMPGFGYGDGSSYPRLNEIAVFGKYDVPYYDYAVSSNEGNLVSESGNDYEGKEFSFSAPLTKNGLSFIKWTVNGEEAEFSVDRPKNKTEIKVKLTKNLNIVAVYGPDPTEFTGSKFPMVGDCIIIPQNTIVYELKENFDQYMENVAVFDNETALEKHNYVGYGMDVVLLANAQKADVKKALIAGDYDLSGKLSVTDILGTLEVVKGTEVIGEAATAIDYDGNGKVTVSDLVFARKDLLLAPQELADYSDKETLSKDAKIKVAGREFREEDGSIYLENPGSGVLFNLDCYGEVVLNIDIHSVPIYSAYFTVLIDGKETEISVDKKGKLGLVIAKGLKKGVHKFEVYGTQGQVFTLSGISFSGEMLDAPKLKDRYIEIIGDSITAGADNLGRPDGVYVEDRTQNSYYAYGMIAARLLDADLATVSRGGSAAVKKEGMSNTHIPSIYKQITIDKKGSVYDFERKPDVVVINLGTNDAGLLNQLYSTNAEKRSAFKSAIKGLVDLVYEGYGKSVPIVFAFGFMTDENYMDEVYKELANELTAAGGEAYYVRMPKNKQGGNGHPNIEGATAGAKVLADFIEEKIYK